jgi:hypothetical protein
MRSADKAVPNGQKPLFCPIDTGVIMDGERHYIRLNFAPAQRASQYFARAWQQPVRIYRMLWPLQLELRAQ